MEINIEEAVEEFRNLLEFPHFGKTIYLKMREYKDAIGLNIEEFKSLVKIRNLVKRKEKKQKKSSTDIDFEIVNTRGIWIPVIQEKDDIEPSRIIPNELVNYILKEASGLDFKIIHRKNNLTLPGLEGKVFNLWFEKIREDYIYGILKSPKIEPKSTYEPEIEDIRDELKKIDYEKMSEIFRLLIEDEDFRKEVYKIYQVWKKLNLKAL